MTGEDKRIFDSRGSTQQFLFSKTDTRRLRRAEKITVAGTDAVLKSAFPNVLVGRPFIDDALQRLDPIEQFAAMVIRLDPVNHDDEKHSHPDANDAQVVVAEILNRVCEMENGFWGAPESGLLASFFPGKTGSEYLKIAHSIQKGLKEKSKQTVTIGIAAYPTLDYDKSKIVDNARKALDHASFFGPGSAVVFDAVSLNISGDKLYEKGEIVEAVEELKKALLLEPANVNVHNSLGVCYSIQGKYDQAMNAFKAVVATDPHEHMGFYNLGLAYIQTGQRRQGLEFLLKANEIKDDVYEIAFQIGKLHLDLGEPQKGLPFLERAAALKPKSGAAHRFLGDCYIAVNRPDAAVSSYKKAIKQNPHDAASMSALGYLYEDRGQNPEIALMFCRESVMLSPENGLFHYRLGRLYSNHNRFDDALAEFTKAKRFGYDAGGDIQETRARMAKKSA
jgi:tetratricopeptide (TPR) repeat protein